jgi:lipase chaperone LimK
LRRIALVGLALALGLWLVWGRGGVDPSRPATSRSAPSASSGAGDAGGSPPSDLGALPPSLRGTDVDGALVVEADGHFRPTPDALDFFDYFLAASGEESPEALRARIRAAIEARLEEPARSEALDLLDRYLAYRESARALYDDATAALDLERRFQRLRELRRERFGAEVAEALFGAEEARWHVDLERRRIAEDESLSPEERARELARLEQELPEAVRATRNAALAAVTLRQDEARLRADGASAAEISALRERRFGKQAADRLDALDVRRADWDARVARYREEREALLAEPWDDPAAREAAIGALRDTHFEGAERQRIRALDRLAQSPAN